MLQYRNSYRLSTDYKYALLKMDQSKLPGVVAENFSI